jgi:putative transposase
MRPGTFDRAHSTGDVRREWPRACDRERVRPTRIRRLPDFPYIGPHRYSLTFCAFERKQIFTSGALVHIACSQLLRGADERNFVVIAYCFMPEHVHLLVDGANSNVSLSAFVKHAKQLSGYHGRKFRGRKIWQRGYFDRVLRDDEDTRGVVDYILMNPVRRGLVATPAEYPFSGSGRVDLSELIEWVRSSAPWGTRA